MTIPIKRVLVAEDSSAVQDFLQLVLTTRGHDVEFAANGVEALEMLLDGQHDIALVDFRLPMLSGLEVCQKYLDERQPDEPVPRLTCMTGNVDAFLHEPAAVSIFERVLSKPLDIDEVFSLVEDPDSEFRPRKRIKCCDAVQLAEQDNVRYYTDLNREILQYPLDFQGDPQSNSAAARIDLRGAPDALLITREIDEKEAQALFQIQQTQLTPIIDLSGKLGAIADLQRQHELPLNKEVEDVIATFSERRKRVARSILLSNDTAHQVLLRMYAAGGELSVRLDGNHSSGIGYNTLCLPKVAIEFAELLCGEGLVERHYFDRLLTCPACSSARLSAREECIACCSTNLSKTNYVHHFRCAHLAPEADFVADDDLICPKCRRGLRQYGEDYDKPGDVLLCCECGAANSEARVTFLCLDCKHKVEGSVVPHQDVFNYSITAAGVEKVRTGIDASGKEARKILLSALPQDLLADINRFAQRYKADGTALVLICLTFRNARELEWQLGAPTVTSAITKLSQSIAGELDELVNWATAGQSSYFLFSDGEGHSRMRQVQEAFTANQNKVVLDFETRIQYMGPEELL